MPESIHSFSESPLHVFPFHGFICSCTTLWGFLWLLHHSGCVILMQHSGPIWFPSAAKTAGGEREPLYLMNFVKLLTPVCFVFSLLLSWRRPGTAWSTQQESYSDHQPSERQTYRWVLQHPTGTNWQQTPDKSLLDKIFKTWRKSTFTRLSFLSKLERCDESLFLYRSRLLSRWDAGCANTSGAPH